MYAKFRIVVIIKVKEIWFWGGHRRHQDNLEQFSNTCPRKHRYVESIKTQMYCIS